jgi:uncharacterized membrane protein
MSERSFHLAGAQLPVCARCVGIYAGFAVGLLLPFSRLREVRTIVAVGALPTVVTVMAEWAGLWQTSNVVRAIAGAALGIALGLVISGALALRAGLHYRECAPPPPIAPDRPPSHI